jgi:hypothetical protein
MELSAEDIYNSFAKTNNLSLLEWIHDNPDKFEDILKYMVNTFNNINNYTEYKKFIKTNKQCIAKIHTNRRCKKIKCRGTFYCSNHKKNNKYGDYFNENDIQNIDLDKDYFECNQISINNVKYLLYKNILFDIKSFDIIGLYHKKHFDDKDDNKDNDADNSYITKI